MECRCDYLVMTAKHGSTEAVSAFYDVIDDKDSDASEAIVNRSMYGYQGYWNKVTGVFVGFNEGSSRHMIWATGAFAHDALVYIRKRVPYSDDVSVARIDFQQTTLVQDADLYIRNTVTSRRYKRLLYDPNPDRGLTLYVGAPSSERRVRLYNKSVEAGLYPPIGEYLRIELQLRNRYADEAYLNSSASDLMYAYYIMSVTALVPTISRVLPYVDLDLKKLERSANTENWINNTVLPALHRYRLLNPEGFDSFIQKLMLDRQEGI